MTLPSALSVTAYDQGKSILQSQARRGRLAVPCLRSRTSCAMRDLLSLPSSTHASASSLPRPWSTPPLPLSPTFASSCYPWAPSPGRHSTNGHPKSAPWRTSALAISPQVLKTKKVNAPSIFLHIPRAEQSAQLDLCPAPSPRGIYTYASRPTLHLRRISACLSSDHLISRWGSSALQAVHSQTPSLLSPQNSMLL